MVFGADSIRCVLCQTRNASLLLA
ncbi:MAG: hypothetical protein KDK05_07955 [Candidatus Competibacteraceae bacterium]|nr:hypothetical protein [Candidatus Competibacteraceae bacterium]